MHLIARKIKTLSKLVIYKNWNVLLHKIPILRFALNATNYIPHPNKYKMILLGGHGLGVNSFVYYLNKINIKTSSITNKPFIFWGDLQCILVDSINTKYTNKILSKLTYKVMVYQLVRCPISTIKSVINVLILNYISILNNKDDVYNLLLKTLENNHFMIFHFTSINKLISHITLQKQYITMNDINDDNFPTTLEKISKEINANWGGQNELNDKESVVKGSTFFRCFPHIFTIDNVRFALTIESKIYASRPQEIDLSVIQFRKPYLIKDSFHILRNNIIYKHYTNYPLVLLKLGNKKIQIERFNNAINAEIEKYFTYLDNILYKHQILSLDKDEIIEFLYNNPFGITLAKQIHRELQILRDDNIALLDDFNDTREFLNKFNIDIYSNVI
ncbi:hypothetical protein CCY99_08210 [Helicobacter sp. 16-1353]|uniref:hypothetical protein n=1 Tax=Helicobacter sp. 16-1353 TaxID=2004996 RepID=UPI000DCF253D|nr:hypothetical protein [Helicobacter sp. 16-1353]RAX51925.1 hypothetical protein CCY99_08210 [Helicobacter sp. 16-1353]